MALLEVVVEVLTDLDVLEHASQLVDVLRWHAHVLARIEGRREGGRHEHMESLMG